MPDNRDVYSPYKASHHQDRLDLLKQGKQPYPVFIQLIISDLCNENCHFCAYRMDNYTSNKWFGEEDPVSGVINNNPNRMIPYEKVVEILDDCVAMNTRAVEVTGGGEPTVHPKHREIFEGIIERGLDGALVTNGVLLRSGVAEILSNFKWVRVSIDAAHAKTYSVMREVPEGHFDKVIKHVGEIVTAKQANSQSDLVVGVGFVVTKENYKEIMEATKIASDLGVDNIRFSAMFGTDGLDYFKDIYVECRDTVREAVAKYQRPDFTVFNLFGERIGDLEQKNPDYQLCGFMNLQTYIGGDQNVYRCCNTAYNPQGFIGSLKFQSLKQLWDSKAKQDNFTMFDAKTCSLCMFNAKNKYINYLIENDPAHKNFV